MMVELVPITDDNVREVVDLAVAPEQRAFVADNVWSLAQAYAESAIAWPRAITVDGRPVGFLMLEIDPDEEDGRPFWLWRLMIDARHQRQGLGRAALAAAIEHVRALGGTELFTSWVLGEGGPEPFYLGLGFEPTGELDGDEVVARLVVGSSDRASYGATVSTGLDDAVEVEWRGSFTNDEIHALHAEAFGTRRYDESEWDWVVQVDRYSLGWVVARVGGRFVGFANVLWDGLVHAFLEDVMVDAAVRGRGIGVRIVHAARDGAAAAGCEHLHVGFDDELAAFYVDACGFERSAAGIMPLG